MSLFPRSVQRKFTPKEGVIAHVGESNNYTPDEDLANADGFTIFESTGRRIWLVATRLRLYSIVDDTGEKGPRIRWSISKSRIFTAGEMTLEMAIKEYNEECGLIDIGYRKDCLYSKNLFPANDLAERITLLIMSRMT